MGKTTAGMCIEGNGAGPQCPSSGRGIVSVGGFIYLRAPAMNNFDLHTPTRILFGKGAIENLRDQIPADARVLVTYGGGSVKKTGVLDQVLRAERH
jgi:hypothetical protein